MSDGITEQLAMTAERLANAAESLGRVLSRLDTQQEALNAKIDRIVAAVEDGTEGNGDTDARLHELQERIAELQKANHDLKAQATRTTRKTLSPLVTSVLAKSGSDSADRLDLTVLDKTLLPLSIEQRIAVKAEMARAGLIE